MKEVITLEHITFGYEENLVLQDISFSLCEGECIVLMGNNGCGKSTLLKILNGLLIPEGTYSFEGEIVNEKYLKDQRKSKTFHQKIGYVFQNSDSQLFCTHVYEEVAFACSQMNLSEKEIHTRVDQVLDLLNLSALKERAPYQLSGGEKRRVAIASVLTQNPDVFILDEPVASLDQKNQEWLTQFLIDLKKCGKTMIIASHDQEFAHRIADRILVINDDHQMLNDCTDL